MKSESITVTKIIADTDMILTDGKIYGKTIYLGTDRTSDEFYEISIEAYNDILQQKSQEEANIEY